MAQGSADQMTSGKTRFQGVGRLEYRAETRFGENRAKGREVEGEARRNLVFVFDGGEQRLALARALSAPILSIFRRSRGNRIGRKRKGEVVKPGRILQQSPAARPGTGGSRCLKKIGGSAFAGGLCWLGGGLSGRK